MTRAVPIPVFVTGSQEQKVSRKDNKPTIQILGLTKHWLNQIIEKRGVATYDAAIMYLIEERQKHLPSGFGSRSDL
jgi:hypothetical protein